MSVFSLQGIDMNKEVIGFFSGAVTVLLVLASAIGLFEGFGPGGTDVDVWPSSLNKTPDFFQSILFFYFILAGFDILMKFVEESKDPKGDIPRSFYVSNATATLLTAGVAYAFVHALTLKSYTKASMHNIMGLIFESFLGPPAGTIIHWVSILLMIATAFVTFLGTTRYIYSIGEECSKGKHKEIIHEGWGSWIKELNDAKVPVKTVYITLALVSLGLLINHTSKLVRLSDFFLTLVMFTVAAAVTRRQALAGSVPLIEGATAAGFFALLLTCCF
jgi:amino acid transporter